MENLFQSIQKIQKLLFEAGIPSIVIGGIAVAAWGEPRLTRDVDLKIALARDQTDQLIELIEKDYVSLLPDPKEALHKQGMVFIQDKSGTRLDLMLADTPYDFLAIKRGRLVEITPGLEIRICSSEDLVIYKLISTRLRDHEDAYGVIRRQGEVLDDPYILDWLRQFELALDDTTLVDEYQRLRNES